MPAYLVQGRAFDDQMSFGVQVDAADPVEAESLFRAAFCEQIGMVDSERTWVRVQMRVSSVRQAWP